MDFSKPLVEIGTFLESSNYRYALIDGLALAAYGHPRSTLDINFLMARPGVGSDPIDELDLERDLPTTQTNIEALRRVRDEQAVPFAEALAMLSNFDLFPAEPPERSLPIGWEPFSL